MTWFIIPFNGLNTEQKEQLVITHTHTHPDQKLNSCYVWVRRYFLLSALSLALNSIRFGFVQSRALMTDLLDIYAANEVISARTKIYSPYSFRRMSHIIVSVDQISRVFLANFLLGVYVTDSCCFHRERWACRHLLHSVQCAPVISPDNKDVENRSRPQV